MATSLIISIIGTAVSTVSFLVGQVPEGPSSAKISYVIANDGANGDLTDAGGGMPDVRLFDETGEFLAGAYDPGHCPEGYTTCTTDVHTQEGVTYALFTGNNDAICIAWTGLAWAGGQKKYGFHPGNWAYGCDTTPYNNGYWYYAGQAVPGLDNVDDVKCAWLDADGDIPTTAFQVHWPEFDSEASGSQPLDYYCRERPSVEWYESNDPNVIWHWDPAAQSLLNIESAVLSAEIPASKAIEERRALQKRRTESRFEKDPRIIKSHFAKHKASELCDETKRALGQSFVSYEEKLFCYMPTKTLYPFCEDTAEGGLCWSDEENKIVAQNQSVTSQVSIPDLNHVSKVIVWGN